MLFPQARRFGLPWLLLSGAAPFTPVALSYFGAAGTCPCHPRLPQTGVGVFYKGGLSHQPHTGMGKLLPCHTRTLAMTFCRPPFLLPLFEL